MILYLDTSALVKKYFEENDSAQVIAAWKSKRIVSAGEPQAVKILRFCHFPASFYVHSFRAQLCAFTAGNALRTTPDLIFSNGISEP